MDIAAIVERWDTPSKVETTHVHIEGPADIEIGPNTYRVSLVTVWFTWDGDDDPKGQMRLMTHQVLFNGTVAPRTTVIQGTQVPDPPVWLTDILDRATPRT